jgi:hypothetical protein
MKLGNVAGMGKSECGNCYLDPGANIQLVSAETPVAKAADRAVPPILNFAQLESPATKQLLH